MDLPISAMSHEPAVVIVSCGFRKATSDPHALIPAGELYTGSFHRAARRAAEALVNAGSANRVLILSARYGLLELHDVIAPYDLRLGQPGSVTSDLLRDQAARLGLAHATVVVLGPRRYTAVARQVWSSLCAPLDGSRGIGEQLSRLAAIYRSDSNEVPPQRDGAPLTLVEELEVQAHVRSQHEASKAAERRVRFAHLVGLIEVDAAGTATGRLCFPGTTEGTAARRRAAELLADHYGAHLLPGRNGATDVHVQGRPRDLAQFLSAAPRFLEGLEVLATECARVYGRWARHSKNQPYMEPLHPAESRRLAQHFRVQCFRVILDTIFHPPTTVPDVDPMRPIWEQATALAAGIAKYYWWNPEGDADPDEAARILAAARWHSPAPPQRLAPAAPHSRQTQP